LVIVVAINNNNRHTAMMNHNAQFFSYNLVKQGRDETNKTDCVQLTVDVDD
jgi:hypothetical protein